MDTGGWHKQQYWASNKNPLICHLTPLMSHGFYGYMNILGARLGTSLMLDPTRRASSNKLIGGQQQGTWTLGKDLGNTIRLPTKPLELFTL